MTSCHTRPPAVAGSFYPADPRRLRTEVAILLTNAAIETRSSPPKALIAPHAGYAYSGAIAAAFATVRERAEAVARIVLVGSAHHTSVPGIAVPTVLAFETPLGSVAVDQASLATISDLPVVVYDNAVHVPEHALEVELPFLQSTIGAFMLVPLLVGDATPQQVALILDRLSGEPETMIVVPPAALPGEDGDRLDDLPTAIGDVRAALLDSFDRQQQVDAAARLVARHLILGHPPEALIATLASALLREDAGFHACQMPEAGVWQFRQAMS